LLLPALLVMAAIVGLLVRERSLGVAAPDRSTDRSPRPALALAAR
jgi:hypothetical protein